MTIDPKGGTPKIKSNTGAYYIAQVGGSNTEALSHALATGNPHLARAVRKHITGEAYRAAREEEPPRPVRSSAELHADHARVMELLEKYGGREAAMADEEYRSLVCDTNTAAGRHLHDNWQSLVGGNGNAVSPDAVAESRNTGTTERG